MSIMWGSFGANSLAFSSVSLFTSARTRDKKWFVRAGRHDMTLTHSAWTVLTLSKPRRVLRDLDDLTPDLVASKLVS